MLRRDSRDSGPSTLESRSSPLLWKILSKSGSGQWLVAANLSADTVDKHLEFNADDMGNLMHELCAMALKVISDSNSSGDRKSGTKRPHHAMRTQWMPLVATKTTSRPRSSSEGSATCLSSRKPFRDLIAISEFKPLTLSPTLCNLMLGMRRLASVGLPASSCWSLERSLTPTHESESRRNACCQRWQRQIAEMRAAKGGKGKGKAKRVAKVSAKAVREKMLSLAVESTSLPRGDNKRSITATPRIAGTKYHGARTMARTSLNVTHVKSEVPSGLNMR